MKIYKYWTAETYKTLYGREQVEFICYGGSNISVEDAKIQADQKAERIKLKIAGKRYKLETYEVEIREELLQEIDPNNLITRNRYGAKVLNSARMLILDIDKPKPAGLMNLFKKKDSRPPKDQIFDMVRTLAATKYAQYAFRIYETYQGARVIVLGDDFEPTSSLTKAMMNEFNCDSLYTTLCLKQRCFRARLTPKPSRMNIPRYKVTYPRMGDDSEFQRWLSEYESASRSFSVCKLVEQVGASHSLPEAVRLHDDVTGILYPQKLA
ncbi:MAG: hypothetical protein IPM31_03440 [Anaerolineae bacterium]|jgi:hypothetical protein|nr:hypothetical protein [Anaerolineae bacterium]MBL8107341.1 hypothetical protein [Anaerolineales bacterium]MCC7189486.1 hypothetical protein [Anaerolineales bacterium]